MTEIERQPALDTWRSLHITREEVDEVISRIEGKMERVEEIVEEQLEAAFDNCFRIQTTSLRELESDPETASDIQMLRQKLAVSYLETLANRIRTLRSLISEQVQA